ncbi:MAG: NAD-dependent epimerase/dehydratase family protein, partial [Candidatus Hydrogenedentales bacterium]
GGAIYGAPKHLPATEDVRPQPLSLYGTAKLCGEEYIHAYGRIFGLRYTILRLPNVYGPRQSPHGEAGVCSILIGKMLAGETPVLFGHGKPVRDYVYVLDVVDAFIRAMTRGDGGTYNIGSSKATTVQELFDTLSALIGFNGKPELKNLRPGEVEAITISKERAAQGLGWSQKCR